MTKTRIAQLGLVALSLFLAASPSFATVNLLYPASGTAFTATGVADTRLGHIGGIVFNNSSNSMSQPTLDVEAAIGKTAGGSNSAQIYFINNGSTMTCTLFARNAATAQVVSGSAATNLIGFGSFIVTASPPGGDWFFTTMCKIPTGNGNGLAQVMGVRPTT